MTTTLTVTVTGQPLPLTAPTPPLGRTIAVAAALTILGSLLLVGAGRRRAARP